MPRKNKNRGREGYSSQSHWNFDFVHWKPVLLLIVRKNINYIYGKRTIILLIGGKMPCIAMKQVVDQLKLDLAQLTELETFAQFSSDLDKGTQNQLARGI